MLRRTSKGKVSNFVQLLNNGNVKQGEWNFKGGRVWALGEGRVSWDLEIITFNTP